MPAPTTTDEARPHGAGGWRLLTGSTRARRLFAGALAAAFVLRLAFAFGYWVGKPLNHDEHEYLELAASLAEGRGFRYSPPEGGEERTRFGRAPGYPVLLAAISLATGADLLRATRLAQCAIGVGVVALIGLVAARAAGSRAGVAAAWLAAVYPPLVWIPAYVLSETLYSALALSVVALAGPAIEGRGSLRGSSLIVNARALGAGLVAGAGTLTRPSMLFFLAIAGAWLLLRRRVPVLVSLAVGALVVVAPWTLRNYHEYGRVVLVASSGGVNFWAGNHPLSPGEGDMAANPGIKRDSLRLRTAHPGLSEEELEPIYYREAFREIARRPLWWAGLLARKLFYTFVPVGPSYTLHSRLYLAATWLAYGFVLPLGVAGFARLWRSDRWPRALWMMGWSAVLMGVVFLPQERYRIPVIDPALLVAAGAWLGRPSPQADPS
jgi:4-amino-4-deoxy-L-arabinose transferase-like glycosyltransferase